MIDCAAFEADVDALVMGLLDPRAAAALEAHAARCPACAALLREETAIEMQIRGALQVTPPADLAESIKAALPAPPRRWRRWAIGAVAAAAALVISFGIGRRSAPSPEAAGWIVRDAQQIALSAAPQVGDRIVAERPIRVRVADTVLRLEDAEVEVLRTDRGAGAELRLLRGSLDAQVTAGVPFEIETPAGRLISRRGRFTATLDAEQKAEPHMRAKIALVVLTAAATALIVRAVDGDVEVQNAHGSAKAPVGKSVGAVADAPPVRLDADREADLRRKLEDARTALAGKARELKRLKAQVERLKENQDPVEPREVTEVLADLKALSKEHGMNVYGIVNGNHPLFKELQAMGDAGIGVLGDLLKNGNDTERFVAAALMEKLLDPAAIPALSDALFGENKGNLLVQRMASHALAVIGGEEAIGPLERAMTDGPEWGVKANSAYGLAQMGRESGIEWLLETYTTTDDAMVRAATLPAMAEVGDPSYLPIMHEILQEETEYSKRTIALRGIVKAGQESSLPILEALINEPGADKMLLVEAKKAVNEITGKDTYSLE